ncbi:hypothetical protein DVH24_016891 [Malus domestica]|uniref:Uncharacterized protein n=1 Tax=Malus domestica TaxID=3750 RepID=A0A498IQS1_MALDO|nr:hypothetical protein DVH24_016891 [Malus domestica]
MQRMSVGENECREDENASLDVWTHEKWCIDCVFRHDRTGRDGTKGAKMPSDGNKEEKGDREVIILYSIDVVERVVPEGEAERKFTQNSSHGIARSTCFRRTKRETERKFTQNSSHGIARSTCFRRTKRETERIVPLHFVPSHVPNGGHGFPALLFIIHSHLLLFVRYG